jgi:hypothetical protein
LRAISGDIDFMSRHFRLSAPFCGDLGNFGILHDMLKYE